MKEKFPKLVDELHEIKHDTLFENRSSGCWVTRLFYDRDDRVRFKSLEYRLGTRENFLMIQVASQGL